MILLAGACLGWIGLISLIIVVATGTGASIGWTVAGTLLLVLGVWVAILASEFRRSVKSPDGFLIDELDEDELDLNGETGTDRRHGFATPGTGRVSAVAGDLLFERQRNLHFNKSRMHRPNSSQRSGIR